MRLETIKIGRIVNAHGIRGEVRVQPDGQDPAFLTQFQTFYLDGAPVTPTANHVHKSLVLMKFPGVDDMNAALALKGKNLYIRRADAKLPEGACFDAELLGMTVCDRRDAGRDHPGGLLSRSQGLHGQGSAGVSDPRRAGCVYQIGGPGRQPDGGPGLGRDGHG